jgi:hypothetical protein
MGHDSGGLQDPREALVVIRTSESYVTSRVFDLYGNAS